LTESSPLRPATPYAVSKVAAEFLGLQAFLSYGLPVVMVRAFNHVGPGQATSFVVSDIGRQLVAARPGERANVRVGNIETRRDITDVRDVVRAYRLLMERGEPGEVYNVCSAASTASWSSIPASLAPSTSPCSEATHRS
jgi:GDP-4-dehydro-6-deoxy-D-mannose reductase